MDIIQAINSSSEARKVARAFRFRAGVMRQAEAVRLFGVGMFNIFTAADGALTVTWTPALEGDTRPYVPPTPPTDVCALCCGSGLDDLSGFGGGKQFRYSSVESCPSCNGSGKPQLVVLTEQHIELLQAIHEGAA